MKESAIEKLVERCTSQKLNIRTTAYHALIQKCTSESEELVWNDYASLEDTKKTLNNIKTDLFNKNEEIGYEAAGACGFLLANNSFLTLVDPKDEIEILATLIKLIKETNEKRLTIRGLWSISKSRLKKNVYQKKIKELADVVVGIIETEKASTAVVHEALQVIYSLLSEVTQEMVKLVNQWFPPVFSNLFHNVGKVRIAALLSISQIVNILNEPQHASLRQSIIQPVMQDLKAKYSKQLFVLMHDETTDILKVWKVIVILLGKDLHSGTTLINGLLEVVEKAFKSAKSEIRADAFNCWKALIDNFSLDIDVLTNNKRLKLILAPLKAHNTKTEDIAQAKLMTWWHLVGILSKKSTVNIETVALPLMKFCFNYVSPAGALAAERNRMMTGVQASPGRRFFGLHVMYAEVLALMLSPDKIFIQNQEYKFKLTNLEKPIVSSSAIYARHYSSFLSCLCECVKILNANEKNQLLLGMFIFQSILVHTKAMLSVDPNKKESIEGVKEIFLALSSLEKHCKPKDSTSLFVYTFLEMAIVGNHALPVTVLNSRIYHIASGGTMGDMMSGTLCNHIVHQLCKPSMIHYATELEGFIPLWQAVLNISKPLTGKLGFLYSTMKEMEAAVPVLCPSHPDTLIKLWATAVQELLNLLESDQIIDQSDGWDNDWGCIYTMLLFPLRLSFDALSSIESHTCHPIMKSWTELWVQFTELTQLSVTAEANGEVEYVGRTLVGLCQDRQNAPPDTNISAFCLMTDVLTVLVQHFRYSELGKIPPKMHSSPARPRKKSHPLHNLAACVDLFSLLFDRVLHFVSNHRQHAALQLCDAAMFMIKNIHQSKGNYIGEFIVKMVKPLTQVVEVNPAAKFNSTVEKKIISMYSQFFNLIKEHYGKKYTGDQLTRLFPIFRVALSSTNEGIQSEAIKLWRTCFSSTKFDIPPAFLEVLKSHRLPPASLVDLDEDHSSLLKDYVQGPKTPSSFMRDARAKLTPSKSKSPKITGTSPGGSKLSSMFNKSLDDMKDEDFVKVVRSSKSGQRVLTEHQLERMREQRDNIPALYSDLSQTSQLVSQKLDGGESEKMSSPPSVSTSPRKKASKSSSDEGNLSFSGKFTTSVSTQKENVPEDSDDRSSSELSESDNSKPNVKKAKNISSVPVLVNKNFDRERLEKDEISEDREMKEVESGLESVEVLNKVNVSCKSPISSKISVDMSVEILSSTSPADSTKQAQSKIEVEDMEKQIGDNDSDNVSPSLIKTYPGKRSSSDGSPVRKYRSGDYTDDELDEELRKTSIQMQRTLEIVKQKTNIESETSRRKLQTPVKQSIGDIRKRLRGSTSSKSEESDKDEVDQSAKKKPRINFRKVVVSPSVVRDEKLVRQVSEVKVMLNTDKKELSQPKPDGSDTDSEDEIPNSQTSEEIISSKSSCLADFKEFSAQKSLQKEENQPKTPNLPSKAKRKRSTVRELDNSDVPVLSAKKRKVDTEDELQKTPGTKQSSSDDSVIVVEEKETPSGRPRSMRKTREDHRKHKSGSESGSQESESQEDKGLQSLTPSKVTRSGRKIVAPKRDNMFVPSTPPSTNTRRRKLHEVIASDNDDKKIQESGSSEERDPPARKSLQKKITEMFEEKSKETEHSVDEEIEDPLPEKETNDKESDNEMEVIDIDSSKSQEIQAENKDENAIEEREMNDTVVINENDKDPSTSVDIIESSEDKIASKEPQQSSSSSIERPNREEIEETMTSNLMSSNLVLDVENTEEKSVSPESPKSEPNLGDAEKEVEEVREEKEVGEAVEEKEMGEVENKVKEAVSKEEKEVEEAVSKEEKEVEEAVDEEKEVEEAVGKEKEVEEEIVEKKEVGEAVEEAVDEEKELGEAVSEEKEVNEIEKEVGESISEEKEVGETVIEVENEVEEAISENKEAEEEVGVIEDKDESSSKDDSIETKTSKEEVVKSDENGEDLFKSSVISEEEVKSNEDGEDLMETSEISKEVVKSNQDGEDVLEIMDTSHEAVGKESRIELNKCTLIKKNKLPEQNLESDKAMEVSEKYGEISEEGKVTETYKSFMIGESAKKSSKEITLSFVEEKHESDSDSLPDLSVDVNVKESPVKVTCDKSAELIGESRKRFDKENMANKPKETENKTEMISRVEIQQEELSPEKTDKSKLKTAVSTPERLKKKGCLQISGTRAAMLLACAKQNIKNRGESPTKSQSGGEEGRHHDAGFSPKRRSTSSSKLSPTPTPRRKQWFLKSGERPWAKHEPSPGASPSSSILKKALNSDNETPSPFSKSRRVSFADPPVSDKVEIPPSPKSLKSIKAQKRLDMTNATSPTKDNDYPPSSLESQEVNSPAIVSCSQPIYSALVSCEDKVDEVVHRLTSPALVSCLTEVLIGFGVQTIGQLSQLTEADINRLPFRSPKITSVLNVLKQYELQKSENKSDETGDQVEVEMHEMFSGLDTEDKNDFKSNSECLIVLPTDEEEDVMVENDIDMPQVNEVEGISPLDVFPEENDASVWKRLQENPSCLNQMDLNTKEGLFNVLLENLPYKSVIDLFHQYLSRRTVVGETNL